jgi:uncharacterized protein
MIARMFFDVAGIWVPPWVPSVLALVISLFSSMVGVSGAFLLVPLQMSMVGHVTPAVSAASLVFSLSDDRVGKNALVKESRDGLKARPRR